MRWALLLISLLAACTQTPEAPAPEPAPPTEQPVIQAVVSGTVRHRLGNAGAAAVTISLGDAACNPTAVLGETVADAEGRYEVRVASGFEPGRCIVADAVAAGGRGRATKREATGQIALDIQLNVPPPLVRAGADALVSALTAAINNNDEQAMQTLAPHLLQSDPDSLRAGIEHLRIALGRVTASTLIREQNDRDTTDFEYELRGSNGARTTFLVQQTARRMASHPLLYYAAGATRYVSTFARLVAAGDAEKLARLLTADDVDYPVDNARALLTRYAELRDVQTAQTVFAGIDESKNILHYRIEGRRRDGTTVAVPIDLRYGDGLLGLIE